MVIYSLRAFLFVPVFSIALSSLFNSSVQASPSPAIVVSDRLVGVSQKSYFVIRTVLFNYPTYYQVGRKAEFVEIEIATTTIKQRCTLRETDYKQDAEKNDNVWHLTEMKTVHCSPYEILKAKKAAYIEPSSVGDESISYRLDKKGLMVIIKKDGKEVIKHPLYSKEKLDGIARQVTKIPVSDIPFQPDAWIDEGTKSASVLKTIDECKLVSAPEKTASPGNGWVFFRFNCWTGDGDVDGANFYIPMKIEIR